MLIHRWMGVLFCILFLVWFLSGIVMMYWGYPHISDAERLARAPRLNRWTIRISPEQAYRALNRQEFPVQVKLVMLDGRPAYRFSIERQQVNVFADNGQRLDKIPPEMARRIATAWTGLPIAVATDHGLQSEDDQWTVNPSVHRHGPFRKYSWPDGQEVYVSQMSGEVAQHTTRGSRLAAWLGAIPHWIYFTPLRKDPLLWNRVVTWSSGIGTVMSMLGLTAGLWLYSPSKRYRFPRGPSRIPYAGQKRWHTVLGLIFGLVTCTWVFSGMMSMSPFPALRARPDARVEEALRGSPLSLAAYSAKEPRVALLELEHRLNAKELELASFAGEPVYLASETPERSLIVPIGHAASGEFPQDQILTVIATATGSRAIGEVRRVTEQEAYYVDRHNERPFPVLFISLADAARSAYYIDPRTGRIVQSYSGASRWNRWLYHGLHSLDLPWLYRFRPSWDVVVLALMLGGTALCMTSVVIGWRRVRRKLASLHPRRKVR